MGVSHSLTEQPYNSIAYRILLMLVWTQYTVLNFVRAVIERLPYIGSLAVIFIPACIIIATMASLPWFLKRVKSADIIFYVGYVLLVLFTMILYFKSREYLLEEWWRILVAAVPFYFIGVSFSFKRCSRDLFWCSIVGVICIFMYRLYQLNRGIVLESDDMDAAYKLLPSIMYLIYYASCKNQKIYWAIALVLSMVIFIFGTRGPIICVAVYISAIVIIKAIKSKNTIKTGIFLFIFAGFILLLSEESLFLGVIGVISRFFERLGFSTRIFDFFLAGNAFESRGREILLEQTIEAIIANPIIGYGFTGDRYLLGIYTHNLIFEIWCHFGIILGTIILFSLVAITVLSLVKSWKNEKVLNFVVMLCCMVYIKLMLSGSYSTEANFYFMLGIFVYICRRSYRKVPLRIKNSVDSE